MPIGLARDETAVPQGQDAILERSDQVAILLKAMASPVRLKILFLVAKEERGVGFIAETLGLREPTVSQQLAQLRMEGLVKCRKDGQRVFYRLASPEIERMLVTLREIYDPR